MSGMSPAARKRRIFVAFFLFFFLLFVFCELFFLFCFLLFSFAFLTRKTYP